MFEGKDVLDYIGSNRDVQGFIEQVSQNTGDHYLDLWLENATRNRDMVKKCGWACEELQGIHHGKTAVLLGASPAINKQLDTLRWLQHDPDFVFVGISSGLKHLISEGIRPKYVMVADADPAIERFWGGFDFAETKGITLIANICTYPGILEKWQGKILFLAVYTSIEKLDRKLRKKYSPLNGPDANNFFAALSSQYNIGAAMAFTVFETPILIFVGNEMGFETEKATYYADRQDEKDRWLRKPHININGGISYTNYMLMSLKIGLEDFLAKIWGGGWFLNCTEAGIFGVSKRWERKYGSIYLPWIKQLTLKNGIAQARSIMRTGKPLYAGSDQRIVVPRLRAEGLA